MCLSLGRLLVGQRTLALNVLGAWKLLSEKEQVQTLSNSRYKNAGEIAITHWYCHPGIACARHHDARCCMLTAMRTGSEGAVGKAMQDHGHCRKHR